MSLQIGLPLMFLAAVLQATVFASLRPVLFGSAPDLVLLVVLAWAIHDPDREGVVWAFIGGLLIDLFSGAPLGLSSVLMVPLAFIIGSIESGVYQNNLVLPVVLGTLAAAAFHVGYVILARVLVGTPIPLSAALLNIGLPAVIMDAVLIYPVMALLDGPYARLHPRQVRI